MTIVLKAKNAILSDEINPFCLYLLYSLTFIHLYGHSTWSTKTMGHSPPASRASQSSRTQEKYPYNLNPRQNMISHTRRGAEM
jgi:hypothetical protein